MKLTCLASGLAVVRRVLLPWTPVTGRERFARRIVLVVLLAVLVAGLIVGRTLRVNRVHVPIAITAPLEIAVVGDFHMSIAGAGIGMAEKAVSEAMRQKPDAIILLGDYVSGTAGIRHIASVFDGMHAPLGVYAILGNHEHWTDAELIRKELESVGIRVLVNEAVVLRKGDAELALVGIDDLWAGTVDWDAALEEVPDGVPVLLASHNPDAALSAPGQRAGLIVSGHTHGGQVAPLRPIVGAIDRLTGHGFPPGTRYGRSHLSGLFGEPWGWVYVTSGVTPGPVLQRWFVHPEVVVLELSQ